MSMQARNWYLKRRLAQASILVKFSEGVARLTSIFCSLNPLSVDPDGINLQSDDGINLISFETSGIYCLRNDRAANGLCEVDPSVFGIGTWSISLVPEPGTLALFGVGLVGIGFMRRRRRLH